MTSTNSRRTSYTRRGLAAGSILAVVEVSFVLTTGVRIPPWVFVSTIAVNLLCFTALGLALSYLDPKRLGERGVAPGFLPWASLTVLVLYLGKIGDVALAHRVPKAPVLGSFLLLTLGVTALSCRRRTRARSERTLVVSLLLFDGLLVGSHWVGRGIYGSYFEPQALLTIAALAAIVGTLVAMVLRRDSFENGDFLPGTMQLVLTMSALAVAFALGAGLLRQSRVETPPPATGGAEDAPPVFLISIDTLRADHTSVYGYERSTTPALERFAARSVVHSNALSPSTWTVPGHAAMLTGMFASAHEARFTSNRESSSPVSPVHPSDVTLAEALRAIGYRTGAIVSNFGYLDGDLGFDQGFDLYDDSPELLFGYEPWMLDLLRLAPRYYYSLTKPYRVAARINETASRWLDTASSGPFFLFLNYADPHYPYRAPASGYDAFTADPTTFENPLELVREARTISEQERYDIGALYDAEIAYVDRQLGRFFDELVRRDLFERSLIIVTSDHGEYLGEHGLWSHATGPYDPVHRVPLLVKYPESAQVGVEEPFVETVDIFPTVMEVVGAPTPSAVQGDSLARVEHPIVVEHSPSQSFARAFGAKYGRGYTALYVGPFKLVRFRNGEVRLYDLPNDPQERRNLAPRRTELVTELTSALRAHLAILRRSEKPLVNEQDIENREALRALGYVP